MTTEFIPGETDPEDWIRENYEGLKHEAESEAPDAWVFQRLIDSVDEPDQSDDEVEVSGGAPS